MNACIYIYDIVQDTTTIWWPKTDFFQLLQNNNFKVFSYRKFDKKNKFQVKTVIFLAEHSDFKGLKKKEV